jgi:hypothetical protein
LSQPTARSMMLPAVGRPIKGRGRERAALAVAHVIDALGDRQPHVMLPTPLAHGHGPIAAIGRQVRRPAAAPDVDRLEQGEHHGALLLLPGGHLEGRDRAAGIAREVELRAPAPTGAAQGVISRFVSRTPFFRAPAAAWSARIEVPSTHQRSQSMAWRRCIRPRIAW